MRTEVAEAPIVAMGLRPRWATTTAASLEDDLPDISTASEVELGGDRQVFFAVLPYARRAFHSLPPSVGRTLMFEGSLEQVGLIEDAIGSSDLVARFSAAPAWRSFLSHAYHWLLPSVSYEEEVLNWDTAIEVAPERPSGTLAVTLKYAGRSTPTPCENPWDD